MKILVLNCGSSSLKYQLINMETEEVLASGKYERIGEDEAFITHKVNGQKIEIKHPAKTHEEAVDFTLKQLTNPEYKVAIVDIQKIVSNSSEIKALKTDQEKQVQAMQATIDKARAEISKEKDPAKIAQLEEKYRNEINQQKLALDTSYNSKLTAIDNKIKTAVIEKARSMNYNIVLPKNTVLYGGDDITDQVSTIIK